MAAPRPKQSTGQKGALTFKQQLAGMCCLFLCFFLCSQFGCTLDSGYVSVQENVLPDNSQAALGHAFDTLTKWTEWSQWNSVWTSDVVGLSPHAAVGDLAWVGLNVGQRLTMRFRVLESDRLAHRFCWTLQLLPVYELQSLLLKTGRCTQLVYDGATRRVLIYGARRTTDPHSGWAGLLVCAHSKEQGESAYRRLAKDLRVRLVTH